MRQRWRAALLGGALAPLVLAAGQPVLAAAPDTGDRPWPANLGALLEAEHTAGMPGVFAEVRSGTRVWRGAAGVADLDTGRPMRPDFSHRVGSITKSFMATTVLQLVGEGRLGLDRPVGDYLPEALPGDQGRRVTVRMLLNHTSGLADYVEPLLGEHTLDQVATHTFTPRQLVAYGLGQPPLFAPGEGWSYSNTNYILVGLLVERITGNRAPDEVARRILRPLGMTRTYFPGLDPVIRGPHALAYLVAADGTYKDYSVMNMSWAWTAGELVSTAADLNTFYRALWRGQLLPPALMEQMRTTVVINPQAPGDNGYGLGVFWANLSCGRVWGHNGGVVGHSTVSLHSPDGTRQVTMGMNGDLDDEQKSAAIEQAQTRFLDAALCGSATPASGVSGPAGVLRTGTSGSAPRIGRGEAWRPHRH